MRRSWMRRPFRLLQEEGGEKFQRLPIEGVDATDEALFANQGFLENRSEDVAVFVEELNRTWQDINEDPAIVAELREQYGLLPDLPAEIRGRRHRPTGRRRWRTGSTRPSR